MRSIHRLIWLLHSDHRFWQAYHPSRIFYTQSQRCLLSGNTGSIILLIEKNKEKCNLSVIPRQPVE
jgi:hypothetical protein